MRTIPLLVVALFTAASLAACVSATTGDSAEEDASSSRRDDTGEGSGTPDAVGAIDAALDGSGTAEDTGPAGDTTNSDAGDGSGEADVGPEPGAFLWPCEEDADCLSGFCIPYDGGLVCTELCAEDSCPEGWSCRFVVNAGGDAVRVCLPDTETLCAGCESSLDCGGQANACVQRAGETFCGVGCDSSLDCPGGYQCETVTDVEGRTVRQCLPTTGSCACPPDQFGDSRACVRVSEWGVCEGVEVCQEGAGWSECTAFVPSEEICDGLDNDCDNLVDEELAPRACDGPANPVGQCVGTESCEGADGWVCDAPTAELEVCDGLDNDCNGIPDDGLCFDGNPCTNDVCDPEGGCSYPPRAGECDDGNLCTMNDRCVEGACVGGEVMCDDSNTCTNDRCDPFTGCVHDPLDGAPCETGNLCTTDSCRTGVCTSGPAVDCGTPDLCLAPTCDPETGCSTERLTGTRCDDDDRCTVSDECANGECLGVDYCLGRSCTNDDCEGLDYTVAIGLGCVDLIPIIAPQCPCLCL